MGSQLPATTYSGGNYVINMDGKRRFSEESWEKGDIKITTNATNSATLFPPFDPNIPPSRGSEHMRQHSLESGLHGVKQGHTTGHEHNPLHALISGIRPPMPFGQRIKHFTFAWCKLSDTNTLLIRPDANAQYSHLDNEYRWSGNSHITPAAPLSRLNINWSCLLCCQHLHLCDSLLDNAHSMGEASRHIQRSTQARARGSLPWAILAFRGYNHHWHTAIRRLVLGSQQQHPAMATNKHGHRILGIHGCGVHACCIPVQLPLQHAHVPSAKVYAVMVAANLPDHAVRHDRCGHCR